MLWLAALSLFVWIILLAFRGRFWMIRPAALPAPQTPAPAITAVIPARDEAGLIGAAVRSLLPQVDRVIVVDDNSSDCTAEEARAAGAEVVSARPLPAGWTGKLWAVSEGLRYASEGAAPAAAYFLLTDADIEHAPASVASLAALARAGDYDLASIMVRLHCRGFDEFLLIPAFLFFFLKLYPPRWIAHPGGRTAGAAGGSILIRVSALDRIGGIAAIRGALIDDCALATAVKTSGGRIWMGLASRTRSLRGYQGPRGIWRMIARTAFTQLHHSAILLVGTLLAMALIYLAPPALALFAAGPARIFGIAAWGLMTLAYVPAVIYYELSPLWALTLPLAALFYTGATLDSALRYWRGSGGEWKGRVQDRKVLR